MAHAYDRAREAVEAGLELAPDDASLLALRGDVTAGLGDPDGALADWAARARVDRDDIGALYSSAFLLEREGRLEDAVEAWRSIVEWNESRGDVLQADWPRQELERVRAAMT
jgi:tetratricopeptide (TPR) repeat protein